MRLVPFRQVDDVCFDARPEHVRAHRGTPLHGRRNEAGLNELDYGDTIYRFQDCGRLEEVTKRAAVLQIGAVAVPFAALRGFVQSQDPGAFERAGFIVSPRFGIAFVPDSPNWVTALAAHCIGTWHAL